MKEPEPEPVYAPPRLRRTIAPPKKQDKRKKFKLEKPAPAQLEEQSVQSSVQEQLVRAEPPPDQSFKRQTPPYRPPPGAPPGKAPPLAAPMADSQPPRRAGGRPESKKNLKSRRRSNNKCSSWSRAPREAAAARRAASNKSGAAPRPRTTRCCG